MRIGLGGEGGHGGAHVDENKKKIKLSKKDSASKREKTHLTKRPSTLPGDCSTESKEINQFPQ